MNLTRQQFCAALQISESTVRRLELDGLPFTPVGRSKRYELDECKAWLRANGERMSGAGLASVKLRRTTEDATAEQRVIEEAMKMKRRVWPGGRKSA